MDRSFHSITPSMTIEYTKRVNERIKKGEDIISLHIGEPEFNTPDSIIQSAILAMHAGFTKYSDSAGLLELRQEISKKLGNENQINAVADNIIVTPGAKQAIFLTLKALIRPDDEVIVFTPVYTSYKPLINMVENNIKICECPLNADYSINTDALQKLITRNTRLIILNSPHNPTGKMLNRQECQFLYQIAIEYDLYIISDEIYEKLNFTGKEHISLGSCEKNIDRVITINGFSKAYSMTGWRIGYLAASQDIVSRILPFQQHINTNTCSFIQKAAVSAFKLPDSYFVNYNEELRRRYKIFSQSFSNSSLSYSKTEGGFFSFIDVSKTKLNGLEFCERMLSRGVSLVPGTVFGCSYDRYVRISLACDTPRFYEAIDRIIKFIKQIS
ncbi:MAG: aminotransferase class I/II-fold pyridoxal phosphate-dependent enzyme [Candidatus Heimdallarchaeota archaeon]|nr:aminotransferase class I/II-fold pyridoxal phosphate-dependent enzyme [Candidatus Heimdallarchaeota archaeon]